MYGEVSKLQLHMYAWYGELSQYSLLTLSQRLFDDIRTPSGLPLSDYQGVRATLLTRKASRVRCPRSDVLGRYVDFVELDDVEEQIEQFCPAN